MRLVSNKPLCVFSGNRKVRVSPTNVGSLDHISEQLMPVRSWGKYYILTPLPYGPPKTKKTRSANQLCYYKIISGENNTDFSIKSYHETNRSQALSLNVTLNKGQVYFYTHIRGTVAIVDSNKGLMIAQFATTKDSSTETCLGDPWLQIIPSVYQFKRDFTLQTPVLIKSSSCKPVHYYTLLIKSTEKDGILHNNVAINATKFIAVPTTDYVYQTIEIRK